MHFTSFHEFISLFFHCFLIFLLTWLLSIGISKIGNMAQFAGSAYRSNPGASSFPLRFRHERARPPTAEALQRLGEPGVVQFEFDNKGRRNQAIAFSGLPALGGCPGAGLGRG